MPDKQYRMAYVGAILYALIMGLSFMFVKMLVPIAKPFDILAYRFTIAFMAISIPVLCGWVKINIKWKEIFRLIPLSLFYPFLFFILQTLGLLQASSAEGGIIQAMAPIFTLVLASLFLGEKTTLWQKISLLLSVSGVILLFLVQGVTFSKAHLGGILLLLLSTLSISIYSILGRRYNQHYRSFDLSYVMILLGFISYVLIALMQHIWMGSFSKLIDPLSQSTFWYSILYLGILSTVCTVFLTNYALSKLEAFKVSVFNNLSTLISIAAGALVLHETITYMHLIGAMMIIVGVLGTNLANHQMHIQKKQGGSHQ